MGHPVFRKVLHKENLIERDPSSLLLMMADQISSSVPSLTSLILPLNSLNNPTDIRIIHGDIVDLLDVHVIGREQPNTKLPRLLKLLLIQPRNSPVKETL